MSDDVAFDEEDARGIEALYTTDAAERRRRFVREQLAPESGEEILSIGCGPGFEPAELAEAVGPTGRIHAVDASEAMVNMAAQRCADVDHATVEQGDATDLPVEDGAFDAAVSVQVFEYLEELDAALSEIRRALTPGGRAVVYATDWDSLVWNAADRDRMRRIAAAWERHCARPNLGSQLRAPLSDTDLVVDGIEPFTILETELQDSFAGYMRGMIRAYVRDRDAYDTATAEAWADDLRERDEAGETLFGLTAFAYVVRKPA